MKLPAATLVIVTVQLSPDNVQLASTVPTVTSDEVKLTVPNGVFAGVVVSATVTLQDPVVPAVSEAAHETVVEVSSSDGGVTIKPTVAVLESGPLVPLTVTVTEPAAPNTHDNVEVPEPPVTVAGVRLHATLSTTSATSPVNPFNGVIVMVEVPVAPTRTDTEVGSAEMLKSAIEVTVKSTVAVCVREPLVPVTVTVTDPATVNVHERVEVPEPPVTVAGIRVQAALSDVKATSPVNPFSGKMVIIEVPGEFTAIVTIVGLAEMVKSGRAVTMKSTVAE